MNNVKKVGPSAKKTNKLVALRSEIDKIDKELLRLLNKRMRVVRRIGLIKIKDNLDFKQEDRWQKILDSRIKIGKRCGLDSNFVQRVFKIIRKEALIEQYRLK